MGAGILPTTIHNGKLYFLFGKENKYEDSAPGFSDFGGGTDNKESFFDTAVREACEELTGFLGNEKEVKRLLKRGGTYEIDYKSSGHSQYRMYIFPFDYDEHLPHYYNNNQRFLQKRLDPNVIKTSKIFEKEEIRWICVDDLKQMRPQFRHYFRNIIDIILSKKDSIDDFIRKKSGSSRSTTVRRRKKSGTKKRNWFW